MQFIALSCMQINNHDHSSQTCTALHITHPPPHTHTDTLCTTNTQLISRDQPTAQGVHKNVKLTLQQPLMIWTHYHHRHMKMHTFSILQFRTDILAVPILLQNTPFVYPLDTRTLFLWTQQCVTGKNVPEVSKGHRFGYRPGKNKAQCQFSDFGCSVIEVFTLSGCRALNYTWRTVPSHEPIIPWHHVPSLTTPPWKPQESHIWLTFVQTCMFLCTQLVKDLSKLFI